MINCFLRKDKRKDKLVSQRLTKERIYWYFKDEQKEGYTGVSRIEAMKDILVLEDIYVWGKVRGVLVCELFTN